MSHVKINLPAIVLMIFCTLFTSAGQMFWKFSLQSVNFSVLNSFFNPWLILGFISYGLGALFMILAFSRGDLSLLYPILGTSYVWISIFSPMWFASDSMNGWKWAGVLVILCSVTLLGYGSTKKEVELHD